MNEDFDTRKISDASAHFFKTKDETMSHLVDNEGNIQPPISNAAERSIFYSKDITSSIRQIKSIPYAVSYSLSEGLSFGLLPADGNLYVGPTEELLKIGVVLDEICDPKRQLRKVQRW